MPRICTQKRSKSERKRRPRARFVERRFKARLGEKGLKLLVRAREETGLAVITELLAEQHVDWVAEYADILQIGTRNAQNFQSLIAAARTGKPILLKRGDGHAHRGVVVSGRIYFS